MSVICYCATGVMDLSGVTQVFFKMPFYGIPWGCAYVLCGSPTMSSFGSEFSAIKTGMELIDGLRCKLGMMGVPIDGPCHIKADNLSVVWNSSQSVLVALYGGKGTQWGAYQAPI
mgnify:CR=1 FL=1